jgi:hypothetical protein
LLQAQYTRFSSQALISNPVEYLPNRVAWSAYTIVRMHATQSDLISLSLIITRFYVQKEEFPTFLNEQPTIIFGRTGRELLIIVCGIVTGYTTWGSVTMVCCLAGLRDDAQSISISATDGRNRGTDQREK